MNGKLSRFTASDGVTLRYAVDDYTDPWKPASTLVLLHAVMGSHRRAYRWVPVLARDFRVVRPDMRGHGQSERSAVEGVTLSRLVQDVIELADHLDAPTFHLAGASAGGIVALQVALDHPERLATLACYATPPGLRRHTKIDHDAWIAQIKTKGLQQFLEDSITERFPPGTDPGFIAWFIREASSTDQDFLFEFIPMMRKVDQASRLPGIRLPTLAVVPGADPHIALNQYEALLAIPGCEFVVYPGLPHNIVDTVPERCAQELLRFLLKSKSA